MEQNHQLETYNVYKATKEGIVRYIGKGKDSGNRINSDKNAAFNLYDSFAACERELMAVGMTEQQALTLEAQLIKQYDPAFNIASGLGEHKWVAIPYEKFVHATAVARSERRADGTIDTPDWLAQQIVDLLPWNPDMGAFYDPMCFDGSFGRAAIVKARAHGKSWDWIEENIRFNDISAKAVARVVEALEGFYPELNVDKMVTNFDITDEENWPMKKFAVAVMNPPWTLKDAAGKVTERNTWKKFADNAMNIAEVVVVVAPMSARQAGRRVLIETVRFGGVEHDGTVVVWSEPVDKDFSQFPKFDLEFRAQVVGGNAVVSSKGKSAIHTIELENWNGDNYWATPRAAETYKVGEWKGLFRLRASGNHDIAWSKSLRPGNIAYGSEVEFERFCAFLASSEGKAAIANLSLAKNSGFINVNRDALNAAFSKSYQQQE